MSGPIHDVFLEVAERLRAKGLPAAIRFEFGRPEVPMKVGATRLYMAIDDQADQLRGSRGNHQNPKRKNVRAVGVVFAIYARSTEQGADRWHHEAIALAIAGMVHAALHHVVLTSKTLYTPGSAGFVPDETTDGWAGRVYEARYAIDVPITDVTWKNAAPSEFTFAVGATSLDTSGSPGAATDLPHATTRIE